MVTAIFLSARALLGIYYRITLMFVSTLDVATHTQRIQNHEARVIYCIAI